MQTFLINYNFLVKVLSWLIDLHIAYVLLWLLWIMGSLVFCLFHLYFFPLIGYLLQAFITQDPDDRDLLVRNLRSYDVPVINHVRNGGSHRDSFRTTDEVSLCLINIFVCSFVDIGWSFSYFYYADASTWHIFQAGSGVWSSICCQRSFDHSIWIGLFCTPPHFTFVC